MLRRSARRATLGAAVALCASSFASAAQAEDFLSALFGAFGGGRSHAPSLPLPFAGEGNPFAPLNEARSRAGYSGGGQAYCVRTCDGRSFPLSASDSQSRAASCRRFCPAIGAR